MDIEALKRLNLLLNDKEENVEALDLTKRKDLDKFNKLIDDLKSSFMDSFLQVFVGEGYNTKLKEYAQAVYDDAHKDDVKIERPSSKVPLEAGLQIHKIVQEYVDTMIKPYAKGTLTDQQINDAYAGLYEFASWIYNR